jgi:acyl carrier protein
VTLREREVVEEIRRIARHELALDWDGSDEDDLRDRLDSLALLTLVVAVEDRFRVRLGEAEGVAARSLADLARLVAALRADVDAIEVEP